MTLKPPTKTFHKLVMREWPGRDNTEFYCPRFGAPTATILALVAQPDRAQTF